MAIKNEEELEKTKRLYEKYKHLLLNVANNILYDRKLSEDAVQEVFVKVIYNLHKINEIDCPRTRSFLVIICRNVAIDMYNKRTYLNKRNDTIDYIAEEIEDRAKNIDEIVISNENIQRIISAIKGLKPIYRDMLLLNKVHDFSANEISDMLNIHKDTVKKRITRAKSYLLDSLEERKDE